MILYLNANIIPTITKPTRITHTSATLIDNIYVRHTTILFYSGILYSDISDHLPICCITGKRMHAKQVNEPLKFKQRPLSKISNQLTKYVLGTINWSYLHQYDIENANSKFTEHLNCVISSFARDKTVTVKAKFVIGNKCMTNGLMKSTITANKLYRQCISNQRRILTTPVMPNK